MNIRTLLESFSPGQLRIAHLPDCLLAVRRTSLPWAELPGSLCLAMNRLYLDTALQNPCVEAVIVPQSLEAFAITGQKAIVVAPAPEELFCHVHNYPVQALYGAAEFTVLPKLAPSARIHPTAVLAQHVCIGEQVSIGPYAVLGENTIIGDHTNIGPHVVIGEDGLYPRIIAGCKQHISHWGGVHIGAHCRIGAHSVIARAVYYAEYTTLADRVYTGFHVSVGHDCRVAANSTLASHAVIGGRSYLGESCWVGLGACISNTRCIGNQASVKLGAAVIDDVPDYAEVSGNFAINHNKNLRNKARQS